MRCRQFLKALVALVVLLALWRWLQHGRASRAVEETILVMGTVARVVVYGTPRGQALEAALEELKRWDALAGPNGEGSLARINRAAGSTPVRVERSVARLVAGALDVAAETEGAFDPTIGAAVGLWDFREGAVPPDSQALSQALGFLGPGVVRVDTAG